MIIKLIGGLCLGCPDDTIVSETNGSYYFQKPPVEKVIDPDNTYFVIPVRNVLYYRIEKNTAGYGESAKDVFPKLEK